MVDSSLFTPRHYTVQARTCGLLPQKLFHEASERIHEDFFVFAFFAAAL